MYPIAYLVALFSLVLWFYAQTHQKWSGILRATFVVGLIAWLGSVGSAEATLDYKLWVLFRDTLILAVIGGVFGLLKSKTSLFFAVGIALLVGTNLFYFDYLQTTFPQSANINAANVDSDGELLVELNEQHRIIELESIMAKYQLTYQRAFHPARKNITDLDDYYVINVPKSYEKQLPTIMEALQKSGLIDWVEYNEVIKVAPLQSEKISRPNPNFGLNDPGVEFLWGFTAMNVDQLYNYLKTNDIKPKKEALIAILDTGIDAQHEDIKNNYTSTKSKYDNDPQSHGTHCAGIAASVSNNGVGIASFSQNNSFTEVTSIKVLNSYGMGTQKSIIDGIILAADSGVDVISMSLGGTSSDSKQRAYNKAVSYANKAGAIVVVAAGNSNRNADKYAPANSKNVITVSAIDEELNRAVFSNWITDLEMGIAAPGVNIYSTVPANKYATYSGTSMATPYVAGLLGLMKSLDPNLTTKEAYDIIHKTGRDTKNTDLTGHLIQPFQAIKTLVGN